MVHFTTVSLTLWLGCNQIAGNGLDLVMADVLDIVDVVVCIPLDTSDHCFVSCVLRVEQSVPEYNVRSSVFLKHRTNWDSAFSAVRSSFTGAPF